MVEFRGLRGVSLQRVHVPTSRFPPPGPAGSVPRLLQYYQDATTSRRPSRRASLPSLGGTTVPSRRSLRPARDGKPVDQGCFGCGHPQHRAHRWNRRDLPSSWGTPIARMPCSLTPAGQPFPDHCRTAVLPPLRTRRGRPHCAFRGSITPPSSSLCTLRRVDRSTTAQHALPGAGQAFPDRLYYLQGSNRRFQSTSHPPSPSLAWRESAGTGLATQHESESQ